MLTFVTRFMVFLGKNSGYDGERCCLKAGHGANPLQRDSLAQPRFICFLFIVAKYGFWDVSVTDLKV